MYKDVFKRFIDLFIAILISPVFIALFIIVGPLIYLQDNGNIFYNSLRLGKNGKIFKMYKFRSMKVNAPDIRNNDGSTFNSAKDSRLTKIGKFIRKTSIDEIPQILNVLKGDMSIIGPRPDLPEAIGLYGDFEKRKLLVRPGITGYSQAYFRNSIDSTSKFKNDVFYVDNISFLMDIRILFKTVLIVLCRRNIYADEEIF